MRHWTEHNWLEDRVMYGRFGVPRWVFLLLALLAAIAALSAGVGAALALESDYSRPWCAAQSGQFQQAIKDGSGAVVAYIDCLTATTAWEVDFADKWYEGTTQALYYAALTSRRPGLALIVTDAGQQRFVDRFGFTASYWGLRCFEFQTIK